MSEAGSKLRGAITALVTPFDAAGRVDTTALAALAGWQVEQGIHGIAPCGTTGEGATLTDEEHGRVIAVVAEAVAGRVPVVAGCGSNDTRRAVEGARRAASSGADALLVVSPYYNKPNRSGMIAHYRAVAEATDLPVMVYNVPGRTGQDLGADLILELAEIDGISSVKEASADLDQIATILASRPPGFGVFSGDDSLALPTVALGADGVVSVAGNEAPGPMAAMVDAALGGDLAHARELHFRLLPLMRANFLESNPVPVKTALGLLGRCREDVRAPLGAPTDATRRAIGDALAAAGIA
jgi:4-hydroxy-tetrahydrodipicolinate synthase